MSCGLECSMELVTRNITAFCISTDLQNITFRVKIYFLVLCSIVFKYNQQDATLHNGIYYYKCSTCFRRFLRPSSGAQNRTHSIGYLSSFLCFLPPSWASFSNSLTMAVRSRKSLTNTRCCVYGFELLMVGGGTAWNMESIYSNKYHCVTLLLVGYT